jgi:hypothetical protein
MIPKSRQADMGIFCDGITGGAVVSPVVGQGRADADNYEIWSGRLGF